MPSNTSPSYLPVPVVFSDAQDGGDVKYTFDENGLQLENVVLKINGLQVVSDQQPAIADAALTLASVQAQLNALLATLRTHGLIAT